MKKQGGNMPDYRREAGSYVYQTGTNVHKTEEQLVAEKMGKHANETAKEEADERLKKAESKYCKVFLQAAEKCFNITSEQLMTYSTKELKILEQKLYGILYLKARFERVVLKVLVLWSIYPFLEMISLLAKEHLMGKIAFLGGVICWMALMVIGFAHSESHGKLSPVLPGKSFMDRYNALYAKVSKDYFPHEKLMERCKKKDYYYD